MHEYASVCEQAARRGGEVLIQMRGRINPREKAPSDLVTEADLASEEAIRDCVTQAYPDFNFLGEESSHSAGGSGHSEFTWVVDPLDGTTNYVHGLENYCVSVALQQGGQIIEGAIYDPIRDMCFRATLGKGAFLDGNPIRVSSVASLDKALVTASLPAKVERESEEVKRFLEVLVRCQAMRRMGSAALNLCYLASGRIDAYWATSVKKWDVAAGLLLVGEAGGTISDLEGHPIHLEQPKFVAAGHPDLQRELVDLFS